MIVGNPYKRAVYKTARKVAKLAQLAPGSPPSFKDLEAFLFHHSETKLPVADAMYYTLADEVLMSQVEPASESGAEALAEVVTAALRMQYEPVADEVSLAGVHSTASPCKTQFCSVAWLGLRCNAFKLRCPTRC